MNPSTEDILKAVLATPAEHVFVLPNNKNIIMAAELVIPLTERKVSVLHTKSIPQGIAAALTLDPDLSGDENHLVMMKAAEKVSTGLVTYAARDSLLEGEKVTKGQILGMENGKITVVESSPVQAAFKVTKHLFKKGTSSLITLLYGADSNDRQANELMNMLSEKFGDEAEISVVNGGQPVYYFIISVE
jgi:dihydroxyacetone kinase-like predicted kinase